MQGEFCIAHAVRAGVLGEFCAGSWAVRLVLGEICFVVAPSVCAVAGFPPPTGAPAWPSRPCSALDTGGGGGFALHEAFWRRVAGVSDPRVVQFPPDWWRRGRGSRRCGRQSADPLGENSQITTVAAEWVCVLADSVSVVVVGREPVIVSVNPLCRTQTRY